MTLGRGRAAELYRLYSSDAIRLAFLLTGDRHLAEDLAQDAFVRLFGRFHDLRKSESFPFYLRRTVVNLSRDHFRRMRRERALSRRERKSDTSDDGQLWQVEARDELLQALQNLPPRQRAAVVLRHCEGLPEREIADVLGASVSAVNSLVSRGLGALRQHMKGEHDE